VRQLTTKVLERAGLDPAGPFIGHAGLIPAAVDGQTLALVDLGELGDRPLPGRVGLGDRAVDGVHRRVDGCHGHLDQPAGRDRFGLVGHCTGSGSGASAA